MEIDPSILSIYIATFLIGGIIIILCVKEYKKELNFSLYENVMVFNGILIVLLFLVMLTRKQEYTISFKPNNGEQQ